MRKILAGVFVGVFVGALVIKLLDEARPDWLNKVGGTVKKGMKAAEKAFMEGYSAQSA